MARPPRDPQAPFLSRRKCRPWRCCKGSLLLGVIAPLYLYMLALASIRQARSLAFTALMLGDLALC